MIKHAALIAVLLSLLACSTPSDRIDYGNPPSLLTLTPEQQLDIYKNIEDTYVVEVAERGSEVHPLPEADEKIKPTITWNDTTYDDFNAFMEAARISGILVLKDGEIVLEEYALGRQPDDRWTSFSVGKSVTSILLGAAIQDGYIDSLDDPATKYVPNLAGSGYDGVTVRQLITMTSGVKWNEDYTDMNSDVAQASSWPGEPGMNPLVSYMRRLPREAEPGTKFVYKTGETDMAGILVAKATGKGLAEYLSEKIWQPYGMERDAVWMVDRGGMERGGCCISMTLRDYGRVGQFMLDGGQIDGEQVVPEWYVEASTTDQVHPPAEGSYGFFWWIRGEDGYSAQGIFGQQIRVSPDNNLVVVVNSAFPEATSSTYSAAQSAVYTAILETLSE